MSMTTDEMPPIRRAVYFVQRGGLGGPIKIGVTKTGIKQRLATLRAQLSFTGPSNEALTPLLVVPGDRDLERCLHGHFSHLREHNEWFRAAPELLGFIEDVRREPRVVERALTPENARAGVHSAPRRWGEERRVRSAARATMTPSEIAVARGLRAWRVWPGVSKATHGDTPAEQVMLSLGAALERHGFVDGSTTTVAGDELLGRASRAGVV